MTDINLSHTPLHRNCGVSFIIALSCLVIVSGCSMKASRDQEHLPPAVVARSWEQISGNENFDFTLRAVGKVVLETGGRRMIQRGVFLAKAPASLRVEIAPPIGLPNLFLSINDGTIMVYVPPQAIVYTGRATPDNLARFLELGLPAGQLIASLFGKTMPLATGEDIRTAVVEGKSHRLDIYSANAKSRSFWIATDTGHLSQGKIFAGGEPIYSLEFKDYRLAGKMAIPHLIEIIQSRQEEAKLKIEYLDAMLAEGGDSSDFRLALPAGVRVVYLD